MPAPPRPAPSRPVPRKTYKYPRRSNAPLMAVGVAILIALAVVVHHPRQASATRGPVQRLYAPISVDPVAIVEKIKAGNFAAVESQIKTYQAAANADPRAEMNLVYAFKAFTLPDPELADQLKKWAADSPDSAIAHCARAMALERAAAHARGHEGGPSSSILPDDFVEMEKDLSQAMMEADSARALDPDLMNAYLTAINAAKMESDSVALNDASKRALAKFPLSFEVRRTLIDTMTPRWGGSYDAMDKFANESQAQVSQNPMLKYLLGFPSMEQAEDLQLDEKWDETIPLLNHAIEVGGDYGGFYVVRGKSLFALKKYDAAMADFQSANDLMPDNAENLEMLALTSHLLNQPNDTLGFSNRYLKLGESDKDVSDAREWALAKIYKQ
jgi:tetratricopeptide (TPR) repeat protein